MKVNWEVLIGLLAIAVTIYFGAAVQMPKTLREGLSAVQNEITRNFIAMTYAFSKASGRGSERVITLEDIKEGFDLADRFKAQSSHRSS